jgi:hypothetical protein
LTEVAVAELDLVRGEVLVAGATVRAGQGVAAGRPIVTGAGAFAAIVYPDGTRVELSGNSEAALAELPNRLTLTRGSLWAAVARQPAVRPMTFQTPHAEAVVLGTQLTLQVTSGASRIEVEEGRVRLIRLGERASVDVSAGHFAVVEKGTKLESRSLGPRTIELQDGLGGYSGTADVQIYEGEPGRNYGDGAVIEVDGDEVGRKTLSALLRWDLSRIPPGSRVLEAKITLHITDASLDPGYKLHEARRPWREDAATWSAFAPGRPWRAPGARGRDDRGTEVLATLAPSRKGETAFLLSDSALALLQAWVRVPGGNHGFVIDHDGMSDGFKFDSRESSNPARRPKLTITYAPPK